MTTPDSDPLVHAYYFQGKWKLSTIMRKSEAKRRRLQFDTGKVKTKTRKPASASGDVKTKRKSK